MDIKGHAAIVTGGGSGLGAATAVELAEAGARVALFDLNTDAADELAGRIGGLAVRCDVADPQEAATAIAAAKEKHGAARIVVNCAGIGVAKRILGKDGPMPLADYERVIRVNLIGTFNILRLAAHEMSTLPELADGERGVIINTASVAAFEARSARPPMRPPRARSSASRCRPRASSPSTASASAPSRPASSRRRC